MAQRDDRRMVVTGAAGFIGSHLVDALLARGHAVVGVDRRDPDRDPVAAANLHDARHRDGFTFVPADLADADLPAIVRDAGAVFHLAAVPGVRPSWGASFRSYVNANVFATHRLLDACVRSGVPRLVYASSSSVYGPTDRPSRESDPVAPSSPYGITKLAGEQLAVAFARRPATRLSIAALRYFTVYGPRQRADMAISRALAAAMDQRPFSVYGDGTQRREFTYVGDVVTATVQAASVDAACAVVNVGGGESVRLRDVLTTVRQVTGRDVPVQYLSAQPGDVPVTAADSTLARQLLGHRPAVGLREGMARQFAHLTGEVVSAAGSALAHRPGTGR